MRTAILIMIFLSVVPLVGNHLLEAQTAARLELKPNERHRVEQALKQLSLKEKIGQMLQVRAYGDYHDFNDPASTQVSTLMDHVLRPVIVANVAFQHSAGMFSM